MAEQSKQVKGIKVDKVLVVPSAEARGFRSREALLQASKHGDALLKRGRRLQQARYPRRRTPMLDDPELRRLNVSAEQYAAVEQRVIDRLAREAGENPYSRRGAWSPISFVAWRDGAACGVAAERARTEELRAAGQALADLIVKEEDGMGREWYELASHWREVEIALSEWVALSPERTTTTEDE